MPRKATHWIAVYALVMTVILVGLSAIEPLLAPVAGRSGDFSQPATAIQYWAQAPAVLGFNHGTAGLALLFFGLISYGTWISSGRQHSLAAHLGLAAGILYGVVHGVSLSLQAATMVIASRGAAVYPELASSFVVLGYWAMKGGGLSDALYNIAFLFQGVWLLAHGMTLLQAGWRRLGTSAAILGGLTLAAAIVNWAYLMSSGVNGIAHNIQQLLSNAVLIWVDVAAVVWLSERAAKPKKLAAVAS